MQSQKVDPATKINQSFECSLRPDKIQEGEVLRVGIKNTSPINENYTVVGRSRRVKFEPKSRLKAALKPTQSTNLNFQPIAKSHPLIGGEFSHSFRIQVQSSEGEIKILKGEVLNQGKIPFYLAIVLFFGLLSLLYFFMRPSTKIPETVDLVVTQAPAPAQVFLEEGTPTEAFPTETPEILLVNSTPSPLPPHAGDVLYLSFDDGPSTQWTPLILDVLAKYNVNATFFVVGKDAKDRPEVIHAVVDAGHIIAHHTWSHSSLAGLGFDAFSQEIYLSNEALVRELAPCIRLPYGEADANTESYAAELGLDIIWWDVDAFDWSNPGQENIENFVLSNVLPDDIILLHDGGGDRSQTVGALETILDELTTLGYSFELLCVD